MNLSIDGNPDITGHSSLSFLRYTAAGVYTDTITAAGAFPNARLTVISEAQGQVEITPDDAATYWPSTAGSGKYRLVMVRGGKTTKWPRLALGDYSVVEAV